MGNIPKNIAKYYKQALRHYAKKGYKAEVIQEAIERTGARFDETKRKQWAAVDRGDSLSMTKDAWGKKHMATRAEAVRLSKEMHKDIKKLEELRTKREDHLSKKKKNKK